MPKRLTQDAIVCPAGLLLQETLKGPGVRCRITQETITSIENRATLNQYCAGDYKKCHVWRKEKEAIAEDKARALHREIKKSDHRTGHRPS
jgi:hypothetical protein